jgi:group I intron endonuclease
MPKTIYALVDPRTGDVRYVGASVDIKRRLREHMQRSKHLDSHSARWIRQLLDEGLRPSVWQLAIVEDGWQEIERYWINVFRGLFRLTNIMDGGQGASAGVPKSAETRAKMSASASRWQTGRKIPAESRERMSVGQKKRFEDSDQRALQIATLASVAALGGRAGKGKRKSPEHVEKIKQARRANLARARSADSAVEGQMNEFRLTV